MAVWSLVQQAKVQDETRVHVLTQTLHESIKVYVSHLYLSENAKKKKKDYFNPKVKVKTDQMCPYPNT